MGLVLTFFRNTKEFACIGFCICPTCKKKHQVYYNESFAGKDGKQFSKHYTCVDCTIKYVRFLNDD